MTYIIEDNFKVKNPWYESLKPNPYVAEFLRYGLCKVVYETPCKRGKIIKVSKNQFDHLIDDKTVTMRAGWKDTGVQIINDSLKFISGESVEHLKTPDYELARMKEAYNNG